MMSKNIGTINTLAAEPMGLVPLAGVMLSTCPRSYPLPHPPQSLLRDLHPKPAQPHQPRLPPKPCDLTLCILPRIPLRVEQRIPRSQLAPNQLQRLLVAVRFEGLAFRRETQRQDMPHLLHQPALE